MEDMIPRQAVLDMLNQIDMSVYDGYGYNKEEWVAFVNHIPSKPKGKWISIFAQFECSECGAKCFDPGASKYCYKCGSPMEEYRYDDFDRSGNEWR